MIKKLSQQSPHIPIRFGCAANYHTRKGGFEEHVSQRNCLVSHYAVGE